MELDTQQTTIVESSAQNIIVVASPGTGKTRTLIGRIMKLIERGADPAQMIVITFTVKAAGELVHRLGGIKLGYVGTLHSFLLAMLKAKNPGLSVINEQMRRMLLDDSFVDMNYKGSRKAVDEVLAAGPGAMGTAKSLPQLVAQCYWNKLAVANLIDYDGILHKGLMWAMMDFEASGFKYLFVDEFQDASSLDAAIYSAMRKLDLHRFYVGDSDQSIYKFRGGNVEIMNRLADACGETGGWGSLYRLEGSYRFGKAVANAAQSLITHNRGRIEKLTVSLREVGKCQAIPAKFANPDIELDQLALLMRNAAPDETMAVLVRTNALVKHYADGLEARGVVLQSRVPDACPLVETLKMLTALLCEPDNDVIARMYVLHHYGEKKMGEFSTGAAQAGVSVNRRVLGYQKCDTAVQVLATADKAHHDIPPWVRELVAKMPPDATASDLLMALTMPLPTTEEPGVFVGTMHSSKGREWDTVFLPAFEQGICPKTGRDSDLEEERRLAFVAMTRARETLWLSSCGQRATQYDPNPRPALPSQFIAEAGL